MKRFSFAACSAALTLALSLIAPVAASAAGGAQTFTITSGTAFAPSEITVHAGQPVQLTFVGAGGVHGVSSSDLGIADTMIMPSGSKTVSFTPKKTGTYVLHCTMVCGPDHSKMALVIKVVS